MALLLAYEIAFNYVLVCDCTVNTLAKKPHETA